LIQPAPQTVNGYLCFSCADVALAKQGDNPAHPPGSASNPTGTTPDGIDNPKNAGSTGSSQNPKAVVFGGALAGLNGAAPTSATSPIYQVGSQFSLQA
jgi:hypothetical protein